MSLVETDRIETPAVNQDELVFLGITDIIDNIVSSNAGLTSFEKRRLRQKTEAIIVAVKEKWPQACSVIYRL